MQSQAIYTNTKVTPPDKLEAVIDAKREQGKSIVMLTGSFDLLHSGHLQIIFEAKEQGDLLLMCLNTDESIQEYKSIDRPIITLKHRLQMMAALEPVGLVTWFSEVDPINLIRKVRPDVYVNGAEYGEDCIEAPVLKEIGSKLYLVERVPSLSTSEIVEKIKLVCV